MRGLFLTLTVLMISACLGGGHLPKEIIEECGNRALGLVIDTDKECVEAAYKRNDEAKCTANPEKFKFFYTAWEDASSLRKKRRERPELSLEEAKVKICVERLEFERIVAEQKREAERRKQKEERMDNWLKSLDDPAPCFTKKCLGL